MYSIVCIFQNFPLHAIDIDLFEYSGAFFGVVLVKSEENELVSCGKVPEKGEK